MSDFLDTYYHGKDNKMSHEWVWQGKNTQKLNNKVVSVQDSPKHSGQSIAKNILLEEDIEEEDIEEDIEAAEAKSKMRLQEDLVILKR